MGLVVTWALEALGLWGSNPMAKLFQQVASLNQTVAGRDLEIADLKQDRTVIEQQLDRAQRQADNFRDLVGDIRRLCDREMT